MSKLKIGIIGAGRITQVIHLPILAKFNDVEIKSICDVDQSRVKAVSDKFKIQKFYTDYNEMLKDDEISAIHICTSTETHKEIALACLEAGKNLFIEKPVSKTLADAKEIADFAKSKKLKVMVGMNNRFRPDVMLLRSMIENKELGKIYYVKTGWLRRFNQDFFTNKQTRTNSDGALIDMGIVMLDLALWMTGYPDIERVNAINYYHQNNKKEHTSVIFLGMKNGSTYSIEVSEGLFVEKELYYCNIYGEKGHGKINPLLVMKEIQNTVINVTPTKTNVSENIFNRSYELELKHFVGAVKGMYPLISSVDEAVQRMKILDAIEKSSKKGKEISFK